jgi:hypothetical protein
MLRENRRKFLIDLAVSKGLDPFSKATWDKITLKDILQAKGSGLINYYKSHRRAIVDAFPEIKFDHAWAKGL